MVQIVNLRTARKQRDRDTKREAGDINAAKHGEAKPLRDQRKAQAEQYARKLDGHRTDD